MNRLRLGFSAVAVTGVLVMAACATSSPHLGNAPAASFSAPAAGPIGPSDDPSDPASATTTDTPSSAAPETSVDCRWGKSINPANPDTGTPAKSAANTGTGTMVMITNQGTITIALNRALTPCTVESFAYLAGRHFFDETQCHRLTTIGIYILQCGDPSGTGSGGPSYTIPDEALPPPVTATVVYPRGTVAMGNTGQPNTGGSQFFMVYKDSPLPPSYTIFGTIVRGQEILDAVAGAGVASTPNGNPNDGAPQLPIDILSLTVVE